MTLRWVLATAAALVAGAAWCAPAGAVIGGQAVTNINPTHPEDVAPYQVAVLIHGQNSFPGLWCGGVVRDARHVITAAHCVFDNELGASGQPIAPGSIDVLAGTYRLGDNDAGSPGGQRIPVESISFDDDYDPSTFDHDAAVLTLAGAMQLNSPSDHPTVESIDPVDQPSWAAAAPGTSASVTGWGETSTNPPLRPTTLQKGPVKLVSDQSCASAYPGFEADSMVCAGDATSSGVGHDACFGDSGGPLVVPGAQFGADVLLGIVSFGPSNGCAIPGYPGGYTEIYDDQILNYLWQVSPTPAPRTLTGPSVQGNVAVGSTVTCDPGSWAGSPTFTYQFVAPTASGDVARTARMSQNSYTVQPGDAGATLRCDVKGTNGGGLAFASSAAVTVPVPQQAPPQVTPPQPAPPQQPVQQDSSAPVARVTKTTCTSTRCTLTVSVTDAGFSAGIQTVKASVKSSYRTTCKRKGSKKRVACTKTKTGRASVSALSATRFKVVASKLPIGKQVFTLVAIDKAGHRQALPTTKTVTTKKPKKKR
jgi:secreted trypsin-like serine protease